jgi:hypothetical protein
MSTAWTIFSTEQDAASLDPQVWKATAYDESGSVRLVTDPPSPWSLAASTRGALEAAMRHALTCGGSFPEDEARAMQALLRVLPSALRLTVSAATTSRLLPELAPVEDTNGPAAWLDSRLAIYRTLDIQQAPVERQDERSLAILYQNDPVDAVLDFPALAETVRRALRGVLPRPPDTYASSRVAEGGRARLLHEIFFNHRAVLFLGHLDRTPGRQPGWQLSSHDSLSMKELHTLLGGGRPARRSGHGLRIPEVIFTTSCSGAWGTIGPGGQIEDFYPASMLASGVRFFIGPWMDVIINRAAVSPDMALLGRLATEFFTRWAAAPDQAVEHLYAAKRACNFPLLTALFQIYAGPEPAAAEPRGEPTGAVISGLASDDRLGDYVLDQDLWSDPYARTFWARHPWHGSAHMVQVLVDEWQGNQEVLDRLDAALASLSQAGLGSHHLLPTRHEYVPWQRGDCKMRRLHVLVYDRPSSETAAMWSRLIDRPPAAPSVAGYQWLLALGWKLALALDELHAASLTHGHLDPGDVLLRDVENAEPTLVLKDSWLRLVRGGPLAAGRFAAPDAAGDLASLVKADSFSLGAILYELAAGVPPAGQPVPPLKTALGVYGHLAPEALDRVARECLIPDPTMRPSANLIARRLRLAEVAGGTYVGELEEAFETYVQAGQRLFAMAAEDPQAAEDMLRGLAARPGSRTPYRLYLAAEGRGLVDAERGIVLQPWLDATAVQAIMAQETSSQGQRGVTPAEVGVFNALLMLDQAARLPGPAQTGAMPVVLLRGFDWWQAGPLTMRNAIRRLLKLCQGEQGYPVILAVDYGIRLDAELAPAFVSLQFPPAPPSELFERILAAPTELSLGALSVTPQAALDLAHDLYPVTGRELTGALRLCAGMYGALDGRATAIRDEERAQIFRSLGGVDFVPCARLPRLAWVGLPAAVAQWMAAVRAGGRCPQRLLITGGAGSGKTVLAQALACAIERPLLRIDAGRCLQSGLGQSERVLASVLHEANAMGKVMVLLDDVTRLLPGPASAGGAHSLDATTGRLGSLLLGWLDALPPTVAVAVTAADAVRLPDQWRRRMESELALGLPGPTPYGVDAASLDYRQAIFAALLRRFGLQVLAEDGDLLAELAEATHPGLRPPAWPLLNPAARLALPGAPLAGLACQLKTGADIESWLTETTYLHAADAQQDGGPSSPAFWRAAIA